MFKPMWLIPGLRGVVVFFLSTGSWFHRFDQPDKSPCQTRVSVRQAMSYWWLTIRPRRVLSLSRAFRCSVSPGDPWEDPFGALRWNGDVSGGGECPGLTLVSSSWTSRGSTKTILFLHSGWCQRRTFLEKQIENNKIDDLFLRDHRATTSIT